MKEDHEVELVEDGKVENGTEEGVAVIENVNGGDAVRDDDKEGDAGKEKDDEQMQQWTVTICSEGKGNENGARKEILQGVQAQGKETG